MQEPIKYIFQGKNYQFLRFIKNGVYFYDDIAPGKRIVLYHPSFAGRTFDAEPLAAADYHTHKWEF